MIRKKDNPVRRPFRPMHDARPHSAVHLDEREVTLLFVDLRGFTELAPALTTNPLFCELLAHALDCLTDAVVEHDGYVIDYYGDGLAAMWNAPADQPQHAELACRAGLQMLATLPAVAADWCHLIQRDLRIGIGIHTGIVQVGNAGSTRRAKYGARGPNVHLASRVESATKDIRVPLLATQATVDRLPDTLSTHRVCRVRLSGLELPVNLFAVGPGDAGEPTTDRAWQIYKRALAHFEQGQFQEAANVLATLGPALANVPAQFLRERAVQELGRGLRRRSSDEPAVGPGGVISLVAKSG